MILYPIYGFLIQVILFGNYQINGLQFFEKKIVQEIACISDEL